MKPRQMVVRVDKGPSKYTGVSWDNKRQQWFYEKANAQRQHDAR